MKWMLMAAGLACFFALSSPLRAHMGDSIQQARQRYGQPVSTQATPGALTSTQTFEKDGLQIVCGFLNNIVEAISFTRSDRAFIQPEIEALLRTNSQHKNWIPDDSGMKYTRTDGAKAEVKNDSIVFASPTWLDALATDEKAAQAKKDADAAAAASSNATP